MSAWLYIFETSKSGEIVKKTVVMTLVAVGITVVYLFIYFDYLRALERVHDKFFDEIVSDVNNVRYDSADSQVQVPLIFYNNPLNLYCQFDVCFSPNNAASHVLPIVVLPSESNAKNDFFYVQHNEDCPVGFPISELKNCLRPALDYLSTSSKTISKRTDGWIDYSIVKQVAKTNSIVTTYDFQLSAKRAWFDFVGQLASPSIVSLGSASYSPAFDILTDNTPELFRGKYKNKSRNLTDELD